LIILTAKSKMMKKILPLVIALFICAGPLHAQQFKIEKSVAFDEPEFGWNKLLQLKNGNTFYFHSTKKEGIEVTVYDAKRKKIASKNLVSKLWDVSKMKRSTIKGLYEINGEPVIFVAQGDEAKPTLYRMQMNGTTAAITKEETIGSLPPVHAGAGYAIAFGGMDAMDIFVEKDPGSDYYAVIFFNTMAHDRSERIRVLHYDGSHNLLSNSFYDSPGGQFKYIRYIGCAVNGGKSVFVSTYGHNGKSDDVASRVIVSRLNAGDTAFTHKLLDFSEDFNDTKSVMLYNHKDNKIQLLTMSFTKRKTRFFSDKSTNFYSVLYSVLDPETLALISVKPMAGQKVNDYGVANIDKDYEFSGLPQNMIINNDNTTTVLSEEHHTVTTTSYSSHGMRHTTTHHYLGPVGISELSNDGTELRGYAINKQQQAARDFPKFFMAQRAKGVFSYPASLRLFGSAANNDQFMSYDYINAPQGRYVIFNDLPRNFDKDEDEEKRKTVASVSATNTICFKLNDGKIDKFYLFGEPEGKHDATFCYIESSHYNKDINCYATLIIEKEGRSKEAKIAWITFK
jgi:hypothetical protein